MVAMSDGLANEKSVGYQLAVLMSLDIIRNSYTACYSEKFIVLKIN